MIKMERSFFMSFGVDSAIGVRIPVTGVVWECLLFHFEVNATPQQPIDISYSTRSMIS